MDIAKLTPEYFREELRKLEEQSRLCINMIKESEDNWYKWEQIAQATIAMRHIEDARMRYWKVIQYQWNWESIYNK